MALLSCFIDLPKRNFDLRFDEDAHIAFGRVSAADDAETEALLARSFRKRHLANGGRQGARASQLGVHAFAARRRHVALAPAHRHLLAQWLAAAVRLVVAETLLERGQLAVVAIVAAQPRVGLQVLVGQRLSPGVRLRRRRRGQRSRRRGRHIPGDHDVRLAGRTPQQMARLFGVDASQPLAVDVDNLVADL